MKTILGVIINHWCKTSFRWGWILQWLLLRWWWCWLFKFFFVLFISRGVSLVTFFSLVVPSSSTNESVILSVKIERIKGHKFICLLFSMVILIARRVRIIIVLAMRLSSHLTKDKTVTTNCTISRRSICWGFFWFRRLKISLELV